jgi:hypothetical protein
MSILSKIESGVVFVIGGIVTITVGFFMLRGTMRMWDRDKSKKDSTDKDSEVSK